MKLGKGLLLIVLLVGFLIPSSNPALAVDVKGNAGTMFRTYEVENIFDRDEAFSPLTQYLLLNITDIAERDIYFTSYTRGVVDLSGNREFLDVLTATLVWRNIKNHLDLHLGRQYIFEGQEFFSLDGLKVVLKDIGPFSFDVYGGLPIRRLRERDRESGDSVWGGRIALTGFPDTNLAFSYERKEFENDLAAERVGIDLSQWFFERFQLYGNTTYNIGLNRFERTLAGGEILLTKALGLSVEYFNFFPTFELEDIFNVFDLEPYYEFRYQISYKISGIEVFTRYTRQTFADTISQDDSDDWVQLGIDLLSLRDKGLSFLFSLSEGFGGMRRGVEINGYKYLFRNSFRIEGGINLYNYNFSRFAQGFQDFRKDEEDYTLGLRLAFGYRHKNLWDFNLELENYNNKFFNNQLRVIVSLEIPFSFSF